MKLRDAINSHQYVVYCGVTAHCLDLTTEDGDAEITRFDRMADVALGEMKTNNPGIYQLIEKGGIDGLDDDCIIKAYDIGDGQEIYVVDDWQ